jgi:hypothetical protein
VFLCLQQKPGDPACIAKAQGRCTKQTAAVQLGPTNLDQRLAAKIAKACGPKKPGLLPVVSGADLCGDTGLGFRHDVALCGTPTSPLLLSAVTTTLADEHRCRAVQLFATDVPRAGELLNRLQHYGTSLGNPSLPAAERGIDLAWTLHLVGDGHQPLHNSARITPRDTAGDRGGNSFLLAGVYPFSNLHGYWDALVGFSVPWAPMDRSEEDYVGSIAARTAARFPQSRFQLHPGRFEDWSREGMRVAQRSAYPAWLERGARAPLRYRTHAWLAAEPRVALAGYRLADMLNRQLGS